MAAMSSDVPPYPLDLGKVKFPATTASPAARVWANRGFAQAIGFNHEEGHRLFELALREDPHMAMAHWQIALCLIANYNNEQGLDEVAAQQHAERAQQLVREDNVSCTDVERGLIDAAVVRCTSPKEPEEFDHAKRRYVEVMRNLYIGAGVRNTLVACTFAESLMMISPWRLWEWDSGKPSIPETLEAMSVLESLLSEHPHDAYACHLYIHLMELSPTPEKALAAADYLCTAVPGQGHLVHMASHIYMWTGQYNDAIKSNLRAVAADDRYVAMPAGERLNFYTFYRCHHVCLLLWAAMFDGRYRIAMDAAQRLRREINEEAVRFELGGKVPLGVMFFEAFRPAHWHVRVRFGKWNEIVDEPVPDQSLFPYDFAVAHYAKGVAYAALGKVDEAKEQREAFMDAKENQVLQNENRALQNNPVKNLLEIDLNVLDGEIAYREGAYDEAYALLRKAVVLDSALVYDEPWGVMVPTRHALGALLNEQGHFDEAYSVFQADLAQYPDNLWGLRGLLDSARGKGKASSEIADIERRLSIAEERSDEQISAACYCATKSISRGVFQA